MLLLLEEEKEKEEEEEKKRKEHQQLLTFVDYLPVTGTLDSHNSVIYRQEHQASEEFHSLPKFKQVLSVRGGTKTPVLVSGTPVADAADSEDT